MASSSTCCILLVYGIPGSGKSMFTDYLCSECVSVPWSMLPLHFDSFYPPDKRGSTELENSEAVSDAVPFEMKQLRLQVMECVEQFIQGSVLQGQSAGNTPELWDSFRSYLQSYRHHLHWHSDHVPYLPSPCVLVIDDNLPLRSMRYLFYQLAKKYELGFAEMCVCCDAAIAQGRNAERSCPIPSSTILDMEQSLELPEPSKHQWELRSCVLLNNSSRKEFLTDAMARARDLIPEALANPEHMAPDNSERQELCRRESLESYLHQADIVLRKSVSSSIHKYRGHEKSSYAKLANSVRKEVLEGIRTGGLVVEQCRISHLSATSSEYESKIQQLFHTKLNAQFHTSDC